MDDSTACSRRRLLSTAAGFAVTGSVAGCTEMDDTDTSENGETGGSGENDDGTGTDGDETEPSDEDSGTDTSSEDELDLREANVVDVSFREDGQYYSFEVTLHHDDDGEEGYANWWQVEQLDGTQLGRRDMGHAHSTEPFTRSLTVNIPDEVNCVVVRGHDQIHGYGGRAMVVSLASGEMRAVRQGRDRQSIEGCL